MRSNRGTTTLKRRRRPANPMREYDCLPREVRVWMATAVLPWRAKSVHDAYRKALSKTGTPEAALAELDRMQRSLVAKDAARIWGHAHPAAGSSPG